MAQYEAPKNPLVTLAGVLTIVVGVLQIVVGLAVAFLGSMLIAWITGTAAPAAGADHKAQEAVNSFATMGFIFFLAFGGCLAIIGVLPLIGGIGVVNRKGRIIAMVWGVLCSLNIFSLLTSFGGPFALTIIYLVYTAYGLFTVIILAMNGKEFEKPPAPGGAPAY
jgi:hypothetical protein